MELIPYGRQSIDEADIAAVVDALRSDWLTTGPRVTEFENAIARRAGTTDAVSVSNGTAALHTAYAATGVREGSEVIVPALTFAATATAAMHLGARVVFADVSDDTGNIEPEAARDAISDRTAVVVGVDYAGHPVEAEALRTLAHDCGAYFVEDAAHSIGSTLNGVPVGSLADLTTFSFFPTKNLTTAEGGAVTGSDSGLLSSARLFRAHGLVRDPEMLREAEVGPWHQEVQMLALNYRLPDVLCALGISQLARLESFKAARQGVFDRYVEGLRDVEGVKLPVRRSGADPMWHLFPIRVGADRRREIFEGLRSRGIMVQVNYIPVYWHPIFADLGYRRGMCPVAERYYREEISLPMFAGLSAVDQDRVIDAVREVV
jgi:dTDP-4-amino-4,6-dideoxygalactose transaminase